MSGIPDRDPDDPTAHPPAAAAGSPPSDDGPPGDGGHPAGDGRQTDAGRAPRLSLLALGDRAGSALSVVAWIASLVGMGVVAISLTGARDPLARWLFAVGLVLLALGLLAAALSQTRERLRRPSLPFRGPSPVLAFGVVVLVTLLATLIVLVPLGALGVDPGGPLGTTVSLVVTTLVFLGVVRLLVVDTGALTWGEMGLSRRPGAAAADLAAGALIAVPVVVVEIALVSLLVAFAGTPASPLPPAASPSALVLDLVSAAVLAPIGEEVFFRGYTTTAWARAVGARAAIVRGALFFSFAHIATLLATSSSTGVAAAAAQFVALLPAGLALGWVFLRRRSLFASIGLHGTYNGLIVLIAFLATGARG